MMVADERPSALKAAKANPSVFGSPPLFIHCEPKTDGIQRTVYTVYNKAMETIAENRRARFDYEISDTYEAGISLLGHEVKSAKSGRLQIAGARVLIRNGEAWLVNSHVPPYQPKNTPSGYEEDRSRKLLLTKEEIKELTGALQEKGQTLVPLCAFLKRGFIKLELGLGRAKKKSDKREALKKRAHEREMRSAE
jgi:SsrA-binding protein